MKFKKLRTDLIKRKFTYSNETRSYLQYKMLYKFWTLKSNNQLFFFKQRQKLNYNYYYTQLSNICVITGNTKLISTKMKISKFKLKELLINGFIYSIKPHYW